MTNTTYPKIVKLENEKLKRLLEEKSALINTGREKSKEIEVLEEKLEEANQALIAEEKKVNIDEFHAKEKEISDIMDKCIVDIKLFQKDIYQKIKDNTPDELRTNYDKAKKAKEDAESERNKIALKAQKYSDKIVPLTRKLMKPFLENEYDDYDTIAIENGEIVASIFNHVEDFKIKFNQRKK